MNTRFKILTIFISFLILFNLKCKTDRLPFNCNNDIIDPNYPTILESLPSDELEVLQEEFKVLNDYKIQSKLNKYGFTGERDISVVRQNPNIELSEFEAINIAVQFIIKNTKFTNVGDSSQFRNSLSFSSQGNTESTKWKLNFGPQVFNGYEIYLSDISVFVYSDGVYRIYGFWYPNVYIPEIDIINTEEAKQIISGEKIIWYDISGNPIEFNVTDETIGKDIIKTIFPLEKNDFIELHVTWKVPIMFDDWIGWHIYVDTMTGQIVRINQEFVT